MRTIDLHVHTLASDGTYSPEEVIDAAINLKLAAIAITDHDTTNGLAAAAKHLKQKNTSILEMINGIEFSCETEGNEIHMLGYHIDPENEILVTTIKNLKLIRAERMMKMLDKLKEVGIRISFEKLSYRFANAAITRGNLALYMTECGYVSQPSEAFKRYIGKQSPCYVPKSKLTVQEAVQLIQTAGGIPVMAHPTLYPQQTEEEYDALFAEMKSYGVKGIEAYYPKNKEGETELFIRLAKKHGLFVTGGSDFHGLAKPNKLGTGLDNNLHVPETLLKNFSITDGHYIYGDETE